MIRMTIIEKKIREGDVSEEKRAGPLMRRGTETPKPTLAAAHVQGRE